MNKQELAKEIELQEERLKQLKKIYFKLNNKANELTNQYWNNLTREWEYNGRKYKVLSIKDRLAQGIDPEKMVNYIQLLKTIMMFLL